VGPLRQAVSLAPGGVPVRTLLGQALLAAGDADGAIRELRISTTREPEYPDAFRHLAMAYGRKGQIGQAELAAAQGYMNSGDIKNAQTQASRAMAKLPAGSPGYLKAEDILTYRPPRD
jgi:predicted Zn-dependent protease